MRALLSPHTSKIYKTDFWDDIQTANGLPYLFIDLASSGGTADYSVCLYGLLLIGSLLPSPRWHPVYLGCRTGLRIERNRGTSAFYASLVEPRLDGLLVASSKVTYEHAVDSLVEPNLWTRSHQQTGMTCTYIQHNSRDATALKDPELLEKAHRIRPNSLDQ